MNKNIVEIFFSTAEQLPKNKAIVFEKEEITYAQLSEKVQSTAQYLTSKGITQSSKVLVFVPMSIKLYQTVLALFAIGAIVVFVDEWADLKRLNKALKVVEVDAIVTLKKYAWLTYILNPFRKIPIKLGIPNTIKKANFELVKVVPNSTALITFTTGSTGIPKAANRTHHFLTEQFRILKQEIGAIPEDQCLITLPIVLLSILGTGATGVIAKFNQKKPEKLDGRAQLKFIQQKNISIIIASPYFVEKLTSNNQLELPELKQILTGGAPVFPELAEKISASFPKSLNRVAYGSTEAEPISVIDMKDLVQYKNLQSTGIPVGKIHSEIELKIIKITKNDIQLNSNNWQDWEIQVGNIGEIIVAGPHVLDQYYNSEIAFKLNKIVDGQKIWHRTGDSGRLINNELFLTGKCDQLIENGESYISTFLVEQQLSEVKGVKMGTLINVNNQKIIVLEIEKDAIELEIVKAINVLNIPNQKIEFVSKIPRDPRHYSKIEYEKLKTLLNTKKNS